MSNKQVYEMTRDELRKEAKRLNIDGRGKMSKVQLLTAVVLALANQKKKPARKKQLTNQQKGATITTKQIEKAKKLAQAPQLTNHVAIVIDRSASMWGIATVAREVFNQQLETLKKEAAEKNIRTTLTLVSFASYAQVHYTRRPIEQVAPLTSRDYEERVGGMTALWDATDAAASSLSMAVDVNQKTTSFLVLVITDGAENQSARVSTRQLRDSIQKAQLTDRWTYAFLLPSNIEIFANKLGVPVGNCAKWDATTEIGTRDMGTLSAQGIQSFYGARANGATRSTSYFTTDMSNVSKEQIKKNLTDLSPKVQEATVSEKTDIKAFCQGRFGNFVKGAGYYQLTKAETVQNYKGILVMEKDGTHIYGGQEARDLLGLPSYNVRVHPGNHGKWNIFVQSTSVNRKLMPGTKFLYMPKP